MPDMKSALAAALNEWNQPEQTVQTQTQSQPNLPPFFTRTTDTSRNTFEHVRDNPHRTARQIADALTSQGHKKSSVTALLSQMARTGLITRQPDGTYFTSRNEYAPVKLSKLRKSRNASARAGRTTKAVEKPKIVLTRKEVAPPPAAPVTPAYDVDALISTLTIAQARDLFAALKRMFA